MPCICLEWLESVHIYMYIYTHVHSYILDRTERSTQFFVQSILRLSTLHHTRTTIVPAFIPFLFSYRLCERKTPLWIHVRACVCVYVHILRTCTRIRIRIRIHRDPHRYRPHQPRLFTISFAWSLTRRSSRNWIKSFFSSQRHWTKGLASPPFAFDG